MNVLYVALAAFFTVQAARFVLEPWVQRSLQSGTKVALTLVASLGFSCLAIHGVQQTLLEAGASAGLATVLHRVHRLLGALGDRNRADTLRRR